MKIELVLKPDDSDTLESVLEAYDDIKEKLIEQFAVVSAKIILDKPIKEIELNKY